MAPYLVLAAPCNINSCHQHIRLQIREAIRNSFVIFIHVFKIYTLAL